MIARLRTLAATLALGLLFIAFQPAPSPALAEEVLKREPHGQWMLRQSVVEGERVCSMVNMATDESALVMVMAAADPATGEGSGIVVRIVPLSFQLPPGDKVDVTLTIGGSIWPLGVRRSPGAGKVLDIPMDGLATVGLLRSMVQGERMQVAVAGGGRFEIELEGAATGQQAFDTCVETFLVGN